MDDPRNAIRSDELPTASDHIDKDEIGRRHNGRSLVDVAIPREESRHSDQRRESRFGNVVDGAVIVFRGNSVPVQVVNVSGSGVMIEGPIEPAIGEELVLEFEGFDPVAARVRWVRKNRIGLDVGKGTIEIGHRPPVGDYGRLGRGPRRRRRSTAVD